MTPDNKKTLAIPVLFTLVALAVFSIAPKQSAAQNYVPLAPIEGTTIGPCVTSDPSNPNCKTNLSVYLTGIFKVGVAGAGVLAFLMIVWGGFTYLSTDVITGKEEGKARIERAVGGLILALTSFIILNTINPKLVELDLYFGDAARQAGRAAAPTQDPNHALIDQQLEMLQEASVRRDNEMKQAVDAKKAEADRLKGIADSLPPGTEKTALLQKIAKLNGEASELDLQRVAEGEERLASSKTLDAYTPEKLEAAITAAGQSIDKIQAAYAKARTEFASDPARVAALSTEEMNKIAVIKKSTAFGIIENARDSAMVEDINALNAKIGEQISQIKTEEHNQISKLRAVGSENPSLSTDVLNRMAGIRNTAEQQICQIKNLCKEKQYSCHTLYPNILCQY